MGYAIDRLVVAVLAVHGVAVTFGTSEDVIANTPLAVRFTNVVTEVTEVFALPLALRSPAYALDFVSIDVLVWNDIISRQSARAISVALSPYGIVVRGWCGGECGGTFENQLPEGVCLRCVPE